MKIKTLLLTPVLTLGLLSACGSYGKPVSQTVNTYTTTTKVVSTSTRTGNRASSYSYAPVVGSSRPAIPSYSPMYSPVVRSSSSVPRTTYSSGIKTSSYTPPVVRSPRPTVRSYSPVVRSSYPTTRISSPVVRSSSPVVRNTYSSGIKANSYAPVARFSKPAVPSYSPVVRSSSSVPRTTYSSGIKANSYTPPVVRSSRPTVRSYSPMYSPMTRSSSSVPGTTYSPSIKASSYTPPIQRSRSYSTTTLPTRYSKPYIMPTTVRTATQTPTTQVTIINMPVNRSFTTSRSQFVLPPTITPDTKVTTLPAGSSRITSHSMVNDMPRYDESSNSCPPPLPEPDYCPVPEPCCP